MQVAECLNEYFTSIGDNLAAQIDNNDETRRFDISPQESTNSSMFLTPTSPDEIFDLLSRLDVSKSLVMMVYQIGL